MTNVDPRELEDALQSVAQDIQKELLRGAELAFARFTYALVRRLAPRDDAASRALIRTAVQNQQQALDYVASHEYFNRLLKMARRIMEAHLSSRGLPGTRSHSPPLPHTPNYTDVGMSTSPQGIIGAQPGFHGTQSTSEPWSFLPEELRWVITAPLGDLEQIADAIGMPIDDSASMAELLYDPDKHIRASISDLARQAGVTPRTMSNWLKGIYKPLTLIDEQDGLFTVPRREIEDRAEAQRRKRGAKR